MKKIRITVLLSLLMLACNEKTDQEQMPSASGDMNLVRLTPAQVQNAEIVTGTAQVQHMTTTVRINGIVDVPPGNKISISNPFGGYIKKMSLLPGSTVRRGEIIAVMEDPQYIQLQQDYLMTKNKLSFLEADFKRQQELNKDKSISDKAFQQVSSEYASQKVMMKALYEKLKLINVEPDQLTDNSLSRSINIYSPIQGYVSAIHVNTGKYVSATDVLLELVDERDLHISLTVFEKDLPLIAKGQRLQVSSNNYPDRKYIAVVHAINKSLDGERSSEIHCELENNDGLLPGMFVNAELQLRNGEVLAVPEDAVVSWGNKQYVFTEESANNFFMRPVEIGMASGGFVEIKNASATQKLVVKNAYALLMKIKGSEEE